MVGNVGTKSKAFAALAVAVLGGALGYPRSAEASVFDMVEEMIEQLTMLLDPPVPASQQQNVRLGDDAQDFVDLGLTPDVIELWEDGLRMDYTQTDDGFEWWYFDGTFDDGSSFAASFYSRIDVDPTRPFVKLTLTPPQTNLWVSHLGSGRSPSL